MSIEFNVGSCSICGQGLLVIAKAVNEDALFVICDDCESQWDNPDIALACGPVRMHEFVNVRNATLEEIEGVGWREFVQNL